MLGGRGRARAQLFLPRLRPESSISSKSEEPWKTTTTQLEAMNEPMRLTCMRVLYAPPYDAASHVLSGLLQVK
jgi:hypothetical protein